MTSLANPRICTELLGLAHPHWRHVAYAPLARIWDRLRISFKVDTDLLRLNDQ